MWDFYRLVLFFCTSSYISVASTLQPQNYTRYWVITTTIIILQGKSPNPHPPPIYVTLPKSNIYFFFNFSRNVYIISVLAPWISLLWLYLSMDLYFTLNLWLISAFFFKLCMTISKCDPFLLVLHFQHTCFGIHLSPTWLIITS